MATSKPTAFIVGFAVCLVVLMVGCNDSAQLTETEVVPPKQHESVRLALKFVPEDVTTYKVAMEVDRAVKWEGPLPKGNVNSIGGQTRNRVEMTYTQRIQDVDSQGNATARIGIETLKYFAKVRDVTVLDFDSSEVKDPKNPMALLVGQSYTIKITPTGEVIEILDVNEAQTAARSGSGSAGTALALLSAEAIRQRHEIAALPAEEKSNVRPGDNWSKKETLSFGMMGARSYEKIYTLKEIENVNDRPIAVIEMNAVPSSGDPEEQQQEQAIGLFSGMLDNIETYTGRLRLDPASGKIEHYNQTLRTEWVAVDPTAASDQAPAVLRMVASRSHNVEKVR